MKDTYNPTEAAKRIRPTWRTWLALICAGIVLLVVLAHFGAVQLWRPIVFSAIAILLPTAVRWDLHNHWWFSIIVGCFVAVHIVVITFISWNSKWVPAALIAPIVIVDGVLLLSTFQLAEKLTPEESSH